MHSDRMAKKGTRKAAKGYYLTQRLWSPFGHVINATGNTVGEVTGTAGNIVKRGLKGAKRLGNIWTSHANMAVKDLVKRKSRRANMRRANMRRASTRRANMRRN